MQKPRVYLIGGAPGAGKTTLGCALAAKIGGSSVTIDDLLTVAKTVTTPESHPDLYLYRRPVSHLEYFTDSSLERFREDAERQQRAIWPCVKRLIEKHFAWTTTPLVIDGWHLRPADVTALDRKIVNACWIHIAPNVLEQRERKNTDFLQGSSDPEKMFQNFLTRSLWYNDFLKSEAENYGLSVIFQDGCVSGEEMCHKILTN